MNPEIEAPDIRPEGDFRELTEREAVCPACCLIHLKTAMDAACDRPEGLL